MKITSIDELKQLASKCAIRVVVPVDTSLVEYSVFYRQITRSKTIGEWQVQKMNDVTLAGMPVHAESYNDKQLRRYTYIVDAIEQDMLFTLDDEKDTRYTLAGEY